MVISFIFFRLFQKYINGINTRKTKGFKVFKMRKLSSCNYLKASQDTIVGLCIINPN